MYTAALNIGDLQKRMKPMNLYNGNKTYFINSWIMNQSK